MIKEILGIATMVGMSMMTSAQLSHSLEQKIELEFQDVAKSEYPGVAAAVIQDGKVVFLKGFGSANMERGAPITGETKFQLGAMSKQFTSLAILLLEDQGKINLNDDIREYLNELPEYEHKITIAHLLNHTSGLNDISRINNLINGSTNIPTQAEALQLVAAQKSLVFEPGSDFSFHESVTESILMAEIITRSSGQSYADYVKTQIFEPLGMQNSLIRDDMGMIIDKVAVPYRKEENDDYKIQDVESSVVGAINAYSSAEDLAKWYLNFTTPASALGRLVQKLDTPVQLSNGKKFQYYWGEMAIGREFTHPERGLPLYWNFGLEGAYGCNVFRFPQQKITTFVLGNNNEYNGGYGMAVADLILEEDYPLPAMIDYESLNTVDLTTEELKTFEGDYWFQHAGYASKIFVQDDTLRSQWLFTEVYQTLLPLGNGTFQQKGLNEDVRLFKFKKEGTDMKIYFSFNDSAPDVMVRYQPAHPTIDDLQSSTGTYYNSDYASLFSFYVEDGQLKAKNLDHQPVAFKAVGKNKFTSTSMIMTAIEFVRDKSEAITGFKIDTDGIHNLVFQKTR